MEWILTELTDLPRAAKILSLLLHLLDADLADENAVRLLR